MTTTTILGDRYRVDGLIGRGGMATVWRATDTVLGREVAVKRLHARLAGDPELEERFRREGRAVAGLSHPNLVRLLDQGGTDEDPFLVFELVEGQDLKTILRQHGRMMPERAASVIAQIGRALAAAHRAGVVHRDIKSHNVLVDRAGVAKLTDFGIARFLEADNNLTRTGIVIGSSDYLAPEQAEGKPVDGRSDIYSLGVVLFEALTGRLPFTGENAVAVATKHVYEDAPDPQSIVPDIPDHIAAACRRALEKDPRKRFAVADAFANALMGGDVDDEPFHRPDEDTDPTTSRIRAIRGPQDRRRRRRGLLAALLTTLIVAGLVAGTILLIPELRSGSSGGGDGTPDPLPIASLQQVTYSAADFDPAGDQEEHREELPNLGDGSLETSWSTEQYAAEDMGGKGGVGVTLTLPEARTIGEIAIDTPTPGGNLQVLPAGAQPGATPLWEGPLVSPTTDIRLPRGTAQPDITLWFTKLPKSRDGDTPYQAKLGEVTVMATAP